MSRFNCPVVIGLLFVTLCLLTAEDSMNNSNFGPWSFNNGHGHGVWNCEVLVVIVKSSHNNTTTAALEPKFSRVRQLQETLCKIAHSEYNLTRGYFSMATMLVDPQNEASINRTWIAGEYRNSGQIATVSLASMVFWTGPKIPGVEYGDPAIEKILRTANGLHSEEVDWRTLDASMVELARDLNMNTTMGRLMVWLNDVDGEATETYERLINQYGFRSMGLSEEEFEANLGKLEMSVDGFRRTCVLID